MMVRRFVVLWAAALPLAFAADIRVVEEIAAKVNGDIITRGELEQTRREIEQQLRGEGLNGPRLAEQLKQAEANALRNQIDELLLVHRAKDLNINVDPEITRRLADFQVQAKISDPDKFHDFIREQYGMSYEDFRDRMKRQMLAQRVIGQEVTYRVNIPEGDLHKYYDDHKNEFVRQEQVFLSQILISTEGKTPEQITNLEKKAKDITTRARKGEKFSELVRENSDDPETSRTGGQLSPMGRGLLLKPIEDVVFKEKKGFITDPIRTPSGFVILKIEDRYEAGQASFEEVKNEIQEKMAGPKMEPKVREYLTQLREQAFLEIKDGYVDSGAAPNKDTHWRDYAELKPQTITKGEVAARPRRKRLIFMPVPGTQKERTLAPDTEPAAAGTAPATTPDKTPGPGNPTPDKQ